MEPALQSRQPTDAIAPFRFGGIAKPLARRIGHDHVALCDLKSRNPAGYLLLGLKPEEGLIRGGKVTEEWRIMRTHSPISCATIRLGLHRSCCCWRSASRLLSSHS